MLSLCVVLITCVFQQHDKRADVFVLNLLLCWSFFRLKSGARVVEDALRSVYFMNRLVIVETSIFLTRNVVQNHKPTANPL